jgi:hypothetical protein
MAFAGSLKWFWFHHYQGCFVCNFPLAFSVCVLLFCTLDILCLIWYNYQFCNRLLHDISNYTINNVVF